jgi:hypothetical protein
MVDSSSNVRQLSLYFGVMALLVNVVNPGFLLDIPTAYMLKNILHASPSRIADFRLLTGIPLYIGFVFGMIRDLWNPMGWRDPGYFRIFVPLMACVLALMALARTTYLELLAGMLLTMIAYSFLSAAFQGLMALIGQKALMTGRLSTLSNILLYLPVGAAYFISGVINDRLPPREIFLTVLALTTTLLIFGFWKPRSVFHHAYNSPQAKGANFVKDVRRLLNHRAIYPVVLINLLWNFTPGPFTPMQFFLSDHLHASDAVYAYFSGLYNLAFIPTMMAYGFLCMKFPPRKLLLWSVIIGVPEFVPMAFIQDAHQALLVAVFIGLSGGLANVACIDIAIRACPPGLQGTLMMMIAATLFLSQRAGDVLGSWIYGLNPRDGFLYCVIAVTAVYALVIPVIPFIPRELMINADGESSSGIRTFTELGNQETRSVVGGAR